MVTALNNATCSALLGYEVWVDEFVAASAVPQSIGGKHCGM